MRPPRSRAAALLVAAVVLASCSSGADSPGASGETNAPTTSTSTTTAPSGPEIEVRVVADSEIPGGVAELLDQQPGIHVSSMLSVPGATMAQIDGFADDAVAAQPDVLVYSGGTNDLAAGPVQMLDGLKERLIRYGTATCVVMAVPVFRYVRGTEAEVAQETAGARQLEAAAAATGAKVASYLDVALAMDAEGEDFFAEGEFGDVHPGSGAYPRIAGSIAEQVRACGRR